jgi:chloramphenicol 3-O-phosphotransferase
MSPGTIILLNGASSSGKSSILKELQSVLVEPYLSIGLEKSICLLPSRCLDRPLWDDVMGLADRTGASRHVLAAGMHQAIAASVQNTPQLLLPA